jgi:hypothetical protein
VQHLRNFGRFEMNKRVLGRQREDCILVAEEEIRVGYRLFSIFKPSFAGTTAGNFYSNSRRNVVPSRWCTASLCSAD